MSYPEPKPIISKLHDSSANNSRVKHLKDNNGHIIEISYLPNIGWEIEVRYDLAINSISRQLYTGLQESINRTELTVSSFDSHIEYYTDDSKIVFDTETAQFRIFKNSNLIFQTIKNPFSIHPDRVSIYEGLMSLKVTNFEERAPFSPKGNKYDTHMSRFQFPKPAGLVLGLPGQTGEANRNGYRFELYNTDEYLHTPARKPLYQSWPIIFFQSTDRTEWIGIFHDNPSRTFVDIGEFYSDTCTFEALTNNTRLYLLHDTSLEKLAHKFSLLLGTPELPPLWAFGYQQCRWSYMSQDEILSVAHKLRENNVPCDAMYLDIDYMDSFKVFTTNTEQFPNLPECVESLSKQGFQTVSIIDPGVKVETDYEVYEKFLSKKAFLKNEQEDPFIIKCWPGNSILPDFYSDETRKLWATIQAKWVRANKLAGIWNDMNEPSNFDGGNASTSKAITSAGPMDKNYNLYGYNMSAASKMGWELSNPDTRGLIITRSGYPGVQRNAIIWHGDNCAWWEHMRLAIDTCIAYSLCGAYYTGADVPGFTGNPSDDLAIRFFQLGSVLPYFRGHSIFFSKDKEPYAFSSIASKIIIHAIELRYSLLREWYSGFHYCITNSLPTIQPVLTQSDSLVRDQFLLFNKFLMAPIIERDQVRKSIYLPKGDWYALGDNNKVFPGQSWYDIDVNLASLPIFVRAGSIVVRNQGGINSNDVFSKEEKFEIYQDSNNHAAGYYYNDNGISKVDKNALAKNITWQDGVLTK